MAEIDGSPDLRIRPWRDADRSEIVALWQTVLPDPAPHNDPNWSLDAKLGTDPELLFVAELDGRIVGTAMGGWDGHRGWLYSVGVAPEHQGRGIGTDLVRTVEAALAERGCAKLNLQLRASNAEVAEFYARLGFSTENLVSMGKRLYQGADLPVPGKRP